MMALLRWHGAEEVEHRSVAFDTYRAAGGGYVRRCSGRCSASVAIVAGWCSGTWFLHAEGPAVTSRKRASLPPLPPGGQVDRLPPFGVILRAVPRYLSPRFHPSHEGRTEVAVDHLASVG